MAPHQCEMTCKTILTDKTFDMKMFLSSGLSDFWTQIYDYFTIKSQKAKESGSFFTRKKILDIKSVIQALQKIVPQIQRHNIKQKDVQTISRVFTYLLNPHTAHCYREPSLQMFLQLLCMFTDEDIAALFQPLSCLVPYEKFAADEKERIPFENVGGLPLPSPDNETTLTEAIEQFHIVMDFILTNWNQRPQLMDRVLFENILFVIYQSYAKESGFPINNPGFRNPPQTLEQEIILFLKSFAEYQHSTLALLEVPAQAKLLFMILSKYATSPDQNIVVSILHFITLILRQHDTVAVIVHDCNFVFLSIVEIFGSIFEKLLKGVILSVAEGTISSLFAAVFDNYKGEELEQELVTLFKSLEHKGGGEIFMFMHFLSFIISQPNLDPILWKILPIFIQKSGTIAATFAKFAQFLAAVSFPYIFKVEQNQAIEACKAFLNRGTPDSEVSKSQEFIANNIVLLFDRPEEMARLKLGSKWGDISDYDLTLREILIPTCHYSQQTEEKIQVFLNVFNIYKKCEDQQKRYLIISPIFAYYEALVILSCAPKAVNFDRFTVAEKSEEQLFSMVLDQPDPIIRSFAFELLTKIFNTSEMRFKVPQKFYSSILIMLLSQSDIDLMNGMIAGINAVILGLQGSSLLIPVILSRIEYQIKLMGSNISKPKHTHKRSSKLSAKEPDIAFDISRKEFGTFLMSLSLFENKLNKLDSKIVDEVMNTIKITSENEFIPNPEQLLCFEPINLKQRAIHIFLEKLPHPCSLGLTIIHDDLTQKVNQVNQSTDLFKTIFNRFYEELILTPDLFAPLITAFISSYYYSDTSNRFFINSNPEYKSILIDFIKKVTKYTINFFPLPNSQDNSGYPIKPIPDEKFNSKEFEKKEITAFNLCQLTVSLFVQAPGNFTSHIEEYKEFANYLCLLNNLFKNHRFETLYSILINYYNAFPFINGPFRSCLDFPEESTYFKFSDQTGFGHISANPSSITIDSLSGIYSWQISPLFSQLHHPDDPKPIELSIPPNTPDLEWESSPDLIYSSKEFKALGEVLSSIDCMEDKFDQELWNKTLNDSSSEYNVKPGQYSPPVSPEMETPMTMGSILTATGISKEIKIIRPEKANGIPNVHKKFITFEKKAFRQVSIVSVAYAGKNCRSEEKILSTTLSSTSPTFKAFLGSLGMPINSESHSGYNAFSGGYANVASKDSPRTFLFYADLTSEIIYHVVPLLPKNSSLASNPANKRHSLGSVHITFCEDSEDYDPCCITQSDIQVNIMVYPTQNCLFRLAINATPGILSSEFENLVGDSVHSPHSIGRIIRYIIFSANAVFDKLNKSLVTIANDGIINDMDKLTVYEDNDEIMRQLFLIQ